MLHENAVAVGQSKMHTSKEFSTAHMLNFMWDFIANFVDSLRH